MTSNPLVGSGPQYCVIHDTEGLCQLCLRDRTIERQAQEIERLRKALEQIRDESIIQGMSPSQAMSAKTPDRLAEIKARVADAQTHSVRNDPLFSDLQYVLGEIERLVTDNDAGCMTNTTLNRTVERLQREAEWHAGNTELNQKLLRENDRLRGAVVEAEKLVNGICGGRCGDAWLILRNALKQLPDETSGSHKCPHCNQTFESAWSYWEHRGEHTCYPKRPAVETSGVKTGYMGDINGPGCDPDTG